MDDEIYIVEKLEEKERRKKLAAKIAIWLCVILTGIATILGVLFIPPHLVEYEEYVDVDWEWDDDFDRYDIFVENRHYYLPTKKAYVVFIGEEFETYLVITIGKRITGDVVYKDVTKFYINAYYLAKVIWEEKQ